MNTRKIGQHYEEVAAAYLANEGIRIIDRNVTCGCDFSAGLEGLGTFDAGSYTVVLLYDGIEVAKTDVMRVE